MRTGMKSRMFFSGHDLKIFWTVVEFVLVDMVDDFPRVEFPPQNLFHYDAMFADITMLFRRSRFGYFFVPIARNVKPLTPVGVVRTTPPRKASARNNRAEPQKTCSDKGFITAVASALPKSVSFVRSGLFQYGKHTIFLVEKICLVWRLSPEVILGPACPTATWVIIADLIRPPVNLLPTYYAISFDFRHFPCFLF